MMTYIYVLKSPEDGVVRYVGKCSRPKSRLRQHISESRIGKSNSHKCNWVRSLLAKGLRPVMEVIAEVPDDGDWKQVEIDRIAHYRAAGCDLTNATDGGDTPENLTPEGSKILSRRASAMFGTPEGRARQSAAMKLLCADPEWRARRDAAAKATRATPEYKQKVSEIRKVMWQDPEFRARCAESRRKTMEDPEVKERLTAAINKSHSTPEFRARMAEMTRQSWVKRRETK